MAFLKYYSRNKYYNIVYDEFLDGNYIMLLKDTGFKSYNILH